MDSDRGAREPLDGLVIEQSARRPVSRFVDADVVTHGHAKKVWGTKDSLAKAQSRQELRIRTPLLALRIFVPSRLCERVFCFSRISSHVPWNFGE